MFLTFVATKRYIALVIILLVGSFAIGFFSFLVPDYVSASTLVINPKPPIMKDVNGNQLTAAKLANICQMCFSINNP